MKKVFLLIFSLFIANGSFAQKQLSLEDIWLNGEFSAKSPDGFTPLKDGAHYIQIEGDNINKTSNLLVYSYETGKVTDTLALGKKLVPVDSAKMINFSSFILSPDENIILFPTASERIYRRSSVAAYFVYNRQTKKLTALANSKQQNPTVSPDGKHIAFVQDNNLFVKDLSNNTLTQITSDCKKNSIINGICDWVYEEEFEFVQAYQWSADGQYIAYYRFDESQVPEYTIQYFNSTYPENYTYKYPKVGEKNSVVDIFIRDISSGKTVKVDAGAEKDQYIPRIKWLSESSKLCVFRMNRLQNKLELLLADASTGNTNAFFTEENKRYIDINDHLTFFNHDKNFIWTSTRDGYNHIYNYSIDGKLINQVTSGKWDVTAFYGLNEKKGIVYFQSAETSPLQRYVYSIKLDGGDKQQLTIVPGMNDADFNPAYTYFLRSHTDANTPSDYALCDAKGKVIRQLEDNHELNAKLSGYKLSKKEFFNFKLDDGTTLNGWMIKPADFDASKKYPVLMYVYGGPGSQQVLDHFDGANFMFYQYLAQHGYIVACVDNRGTGARGEEFQKMTYLHLGKIEVQDQISAAKYLATQSYIDASRIGIFGWSYGGYMSSLCIEYGAGIFKSAVSVAPVTNWKFYDSIYTERYMRTTKDNSAGYEEMAPMNNAAKIKGHLLLVHGLADDNVHYQNSAEFIKKLYQNNIAFQQMTFPDKNHGISGGNTRFYLFTQISDFLFTNL
jgi:dipeptidyl-peptidase-4